MYQEFYNHLLSSFEDNDYISILKTPFKMQENVLKTHVKPCGVWFSYANTCDNWINWCLDEQPDWINPNSHFIYKMDIINDSCRILCITNLDQLKWFHDTYKKKINGFFYMIQWELVQNDGWSGILIDSMTIENNEINNWYIGWDCSSGCIWDTSIIKMTLLT